jgi:hypothetical protein
LPAASCYFTKPTAYQWLLFNWLLSRLLLC